MKRYLLATFGVLALVTLVYVASCGETDPVFAPAGSSVILPEDQEWTFNCMGGINVPGSCYDAYREYCVNGCEQTLQLGNSVNGDVDQRYEDCYDACTNGGQAPETCVAQCSEQACDTYDGWVDYCEKDSVYNQVQIYLQSKDGRCGWMSYIVTAFVNGPATTEAGETEKVSYPMNEVEVEWVIVGGELYELGDVPGEIPPLPNPFYDRTNDRGLSQVKYRLPLPNTCGESMTYVLSASIGVDNDEVKYRFTAEDLDEDSTTTDDDDDDDDDSV